MSMIMVMIIRMAPLIIPTLVDIVIAIIMITIITHTPEAMIIVMIMMTIRALLKNIDQQNLIWINLRVR